MHLYIYLLKVHDYVYDKHSFLAWNFMRMTDEDHYIVSMLHYGERKHSCVQLGAFVMNSSSNWFESKFLLFQNGKKSLQCDLTILGSFLSTGMIRVFEQMLHMNPSLVM